MVQAKKSHPSDVVVVDSMRWDEMGKVTVTVIGTGKERKKGERW